VKQFRQSSGFSLLELAIVVVLIGILIGVAIPQTRRTMQNGRTKAAAKSAANMLSFARTSARASNRTFLVFFGVDAEAKGLKGLSGEPASIVVVDDSPSPNCKIDGDEQIWSVPEFEDGIDFQLATVEGAVAIAGDAGSGNPSAGFKGTSFTDSSGASARWILFGADGVPRRFKTGTGCKPNATSEVGRGGGTVYLAGAIPGEDLSTGRQYAIELAPLGGVKVHRFDWSRKAWRVR